MLISELMKILSDAKGVHGDIEVLFDPDSNVDGMYHFCRLNSRGVPYVSASRGGESLYVPIEIA